ncbi:ArsR/SmtB family transcription factor [Moraxella marmotae]|uniref:ArsR/SmtB family transcription factor n=1 Tax=Moraxella marmotae TaxID=3344520 RepID=UPI0035F4845A
MQDILPNPTFPEQAKQASDFLRVLANENRLQILCLLIEHGEMSVGQIHAMTTLSQSALSQHLAKMRDEGLVSYRRQSQTLFYRICDDKVARIILVLKEIFCP